MSESYVDATEIVGSLPPEIIGMTDTMLADYLSANPDVKNKLIEFFNINYPARNFIPNVGQEKAVLPLKTLDITKDEMLVGCFAGGNGVGKTTMIPIMMIGASLGKKELGSFFSDWTVFDKFEMIRIEERRPIMIRLICDGTQMKDDGGLFKEIKKQFPKGRLTWQKDKAAFYQSGIIRKTEEKNSEIVANIQVRTFEQDARVHAGDNIDLILVNEPMPKHLYSENIGRLRTRHGGIFWMFATPLAEGAWIKDNIADDPIHAPNFTSASLWDNCMDWHPDPEMWSGGAVGVGKVLTRGTRPKSVFDAQIREWQKEGKAVADARINGSFTHFAGVVLPEFDASVHVVKSFDIPKDWPIWCVMDPHNGGKSNFISWWAQNPDEEFFRIEEYPEERWDKCSKVESTKACCDSIRIIERRFANQVVYRYADPAIAKFHREEGDKIYYLLQEFAKYGYKFNLANNDPFIGLSRLRDALMFDKAHEVDDWNKPSMYLFDASYYTGRPLQNMALAFQNWTYKEGYSQKDSSTAFSNIVTQLWKDPVDTARYLCAEKKPFRPVLRKSQIIEKAPVLTNRAPRDW